MKTKAQKGYVLMLTTAIMTIVALLVAVVFTLSVICTNSASAYNDFNKRKRDMTNDSYVALFSNIKFENEQFIYENVEELTYCSFVENSLITSSENNGEFSLNYNNSTFNVKINFKYEEAKKSITGLTFYSSQDSTSQVEGV